MMISIIVPVYNAENYIERCLGSICRQSFTDLEIIAINDGSKDCSLKVLNDYALNDARIKVISQKNRGVAAARNVGLKHATGEYFLFVDADDWIEPDMVERLLQVVDMNTDIVFCCSDNARIAEEATRTEKIVYEIWNQERQQIEFMKHKRMTGMLWNKLIRLNLVEGISFNEKTGYGEDAEFLWQILKRSKKMIVTNEILYHHVLEETSISHLMFSEKKYSAIPMWETIVEETRREYPQLYVLAKERLMCATVFSCYEIRKCSYSNWEQENHMLSIIRKYIGSFLLSPNVSVKFKLYAVAMYMGIRI